MESLRSVVGSEPDIFHHYQVPPAFDNSLHKILTSHLISDLSLLSVPPNLGVDFPQGSLPRV